MRPKWFSDFEKSILFPKIFLILLFPFLFEILLWTFYDPFYYPDMNEIILIFMTISICLVLFIIVFRSFKKASILTFALLSFVISFPELANMSELINFSNKPLRLFFLWGLIPLISLITAFMSYLAISYVLSRKIIINGIAFVSIVTMGLILIKVNPTIHSPNLKILPDVILVVMDTTRADHLSVYGYLRRTSPGLEWLSSKAAVYENAMSPAPWTPPGHASIFTGLLPAKHGTDGDFKVFNPPGSTLTEILLDAGYETAAIVNNPMLDSGFGWNRGFKHYKKTWNKPPTSISQIIWKIKRKHPDWPWIGSTKRTIRSAKRWWAYHNKKPKFLFLNLIDPHSPYGEDHEYKDFFLDSKLKNIPDISNDSEDYDSGLARAEGDELKKVIARYDGDIRYMDSCLENFFRWIEKRGELDNSLIIITSDHGERLGEKGLLGHQVGLDHVLLHVPLIVRYPPKVSPGRYAHLVQSHGIFLSVLNILGLKPKEDDSGRMLPIENQSLSFSVAQMRHQDEYINSLTRTNPKFNPDQFKGNWSSIYDGQWELQKSTTGVIRLFNLKEDPAEEKDVSQIHSPEVNRLLPYLKTLDTYKESIERKEITEKVKELLKSLGYVH